MVKTKGVARAKERFKARVQIAGPEYELGIKSPRTNWDEGYADAWDRIKEGIREAIEAGIPLGGVKRKGARILEFEGDKEGSAEMEG
jgi:hypothetical protein